MPSARAIRFDLDVPIGPEWHNVELLRSAILNCLAAVFQNDELGSGVGMVAGELIENAIKYGDWSRGDRAQFKLHVRGDESGLDVQVTNPVKSPKDAAEALRVVAWLKQQPSPLDAYRARLREISERAPSDDSGSGLGLVRVLYEGDCTLDATLDDDVLSMHARSRSL